MSIGTAAVGRCFSTQAEAASVYCSSVAGVTSAGVVSCSGSTGSAALSTTAGGNVVYPWVMSTQPTTGAPVTVETSTILHACETYDVTYWSPSIAAWVTALVFILAAKLVGQRVFNRETL